MSLRIAFVTGWGVVPEHGGQGTFCAQLTAALAARGHEVALLSRNVSSWKTWADNAGLTGEVEITSPSPARLLKADVVHLNGPAVRILAWTALLKCPTVITHEDYHLRCPKGIAWQADGCDVSVDRPSLCGRCRSETPMSRVRLRVQARLARRTRSVAVSEYVRQRLGLNETVLHPFDASSQPDLSRSPVERRVAFIGRLVPEKGPQIAVDALRLLEDVHLDVYGEGVLRGALEDQARALGVRERLHIRGAVPAPVVASASASAILVPGLWNEPLGYVTIEAMAAGKAVIATAVGGSCELLADERGWLVPPGDARSLAAAIEQVVNEPGERIRRGVRAREFVRRVLDPDCIAGQYEEIYAREIRGRHS